MGASIKHGVLYLDGAPCETSEDLLFGPEKKYSTPEGETEWHRPGPSDAVKDVLAAGLPVAQKLINEECIDRLTAMEFRRDLEEWFGRALNLARNALIATDSTADPEKERTALEQLILKTAEKIRAQLAPLEAAEIATLAPIIASLLPDEASPSVRCISMHQLQDLGFPQPYIYNNCFKGEAGRSGATLIEDLIAYFARTWNLNETTLKEAVEAATTEEIKAGRRLKAELREQCDALKNTRQRAAQLIGSSPELLEAVRQAITNKDGAAINLFKSLPISIQGPKSLLDIDDLASGERVNKLYSRIEDTFVSPDETIKALNKALSLAQLEKIKEEITRTLKSLEAKINQTLAGINTLIDSSRSKIAGIA